ncbi:BIG1-domain-containing protein [Myriangium duriaei CBS 260.36]|uniref:Protein BIG1 n=1 Tax=Myriangium duriaei CBS 260.36 TaxID=1168546 RepID=A0A9P4J843_9PEZI|nr:BIG1-domain-containing protein [Myriangium duriaei CBS 260.36]
MRLTTVATAAAAAGSVSAFKDTSPFFLFSSSRLSELSTNVKEGNDIATASTVKEQVSSMLHGCLSDTYLVVYQPGVSTLDFEGSADVPHLKRWLSGEDSSIKSRHVVGSIVGDLEGASLSSRLSKHCDAKVVTLDGQRLPAKDATLPQVLTVDLPGLSPSSPQRQVDLSKNDAYLNSVILSLPSEKYTVIFRTSPPASPQYKSGGGEAQQQHLYDMDEQYSSSMHGHFRRDVNAYPKASNGSNLDSDLPLFEKYQFFNSGIFMGLLVSLLLLSILYIGISAVAGLEVSYYAFSKEFNPASHKKQS